MVNSLFERYQREGFVALKEPGPNAVPFDLSGYSPDLIAKKEGESLIIEVKPRTERISFDTLRSLAAEVKRHPGWRFILVTGEDVDDAILPGQAVESFSWHEVEKALKEAEATSHYPSTFAFIMLWIEFERMMRFRSRLITLPVDRLVSPRILVNQLYTHGELSAEQLQTASDLISVRNQVVHGFDVNDLGDSLQSLTRLVRETRAEWSESAADDITPL